MKIAEDGEVLIKGPNIFQGYYKNEAATAEALEDRWLHTGDLGRLDEDGFLYITGRKKDIIITAGGKNITPANLENGLKQSRWISQAVVVGDRRPVPGRADHARRRGGAGARAGAGRRTTRPRCAQDERVHAEIQKVVDEVNSHVGPVEQIKRFADPAGGPLPGDGELTPTLKVKRNVVHEKYAGTIDGVYERADRLGLAAAAGSAGCARFDRRTHLGRRVPPPPWPATTPPTPADCSSGAVPARRRCASATPSRTPARAAATPDALLAHGLLALELVMCLSLFGPQPAAWLWVGSQVQYLTGYVTAGIATIMLGCLASLMITMAAGQASGPRLEARAPRRRPPPGARSARAHLRRERRAWPWWSSRSGSSSSRARPRASPRRSSDVDLFGYYRQFDDIDEEEMNRERRERRAARAQAGARAGPGPRPLGHRVARPAPLGDRERRDRAGPRPRERLSGPLRQRHPAPAGRAPRRGPRAGRARQRRGRAAPVGRAGAALRGRRAGDALAVLSALPADGHARAGPAGVRDGGGREPTTAPRWRGR